MPKASNHSGPKGPENDFCYRKSREIIILRISGISIVYHMNNMIILQIIKCVFLVSTNLYFQRLLSIEKLSVMID